MKKINYVLLTALAAMSCGAFAQNFSLQDTSLKYDTSEFGTSAIKQDILELSQVVKVGDFWPVTVSVQAGRSNHDTASGLSLSTSKAYSLADNGWKLKADAKLSTGSVRTVGDALWAAGTSFDVTKATTMVDLGVTSYYPLVQEKSVAVNLITAGTVAQGLESYTTAYHPTAFKNGLELTSTSSLGTLTFQGVYSQYSGSNVAIDAATEYSVGFTHNGITVKVSTTAGSKDYKNTSIGVVYPF